MKKLPLYLARILLSAIFIISGIMKILDMEGTMKYMQANGMPFTMFFLICAIILELSGGILILTGKYEKIGARILILFLVPTTLIFHTDFSQRMQVIQFLKNSAIIGGLFAVISKEGKIENND
ncbi:MAG: DoxX family protein [Candidatus Schekmanbacteria bacterium]|nr:MAG: DoxX family protein [Candidatus Schekmanbacteria bacterium]